MIKTGQANKNVKMKKVPLVLLNTLLSVTYNCAWSLPVQEVVVSEDAAQCEDMGAGLFCDFKSSQEDVVYVRPLMNQAIENVFIYSATKLRLSDEVCTNITLHNVKGARLIKSPSDSCQKLIEVSATKSEFISIHAGIHKLQLEDCAVETLVIDSEISKVTISKSKIKHLNITGRFQRETEVLLQDTQIYFVEKLILESGCMVKFKNSIIENIKPNSLEIYNGSLKMTDSSFVKASVDNLILKNFKGNLTLGGFIISDNDKNAQKTFKNVCECKQNNTYVVLFYLNLILLILSWIMFIVYHMKEMILVRIERVLRTSTANQDDLELRKGQRQDRSEMKAMLQDAKTNLGDQQGIVKSAESSLSESRVERIKRHLKDLQEMMNSLRGTKNSSESGLMKITDTQSSNDHNDYIMNLSELKMLHSKLRKSSDELKSICEKQSKIKEVLETAETALKNEEIFTINKLFISDIEKDFTKNFISDNDPSSFADDVIKCKSELDMFIHTMNKPLNAKDIMKQGKELEKKKEKEV